MLCTGGVPEFARHGDVIRTGVGLVGPTVGNCPANEKKAN